MHTSQVHQIIEEWTSAPLPQYQPVEQGNAQSFEPFPLRIQGAVLSALKLLRECMVLDALPTSWHFQMNCNIPGLQSKFSELMSPELKFVCSWWVTILCKADCHGDSIILALSHLKPVLLHWVAAMGIMGKLEQACESLFRLYCWLVCTWPRK